MKRLILFLACLSYISSVFAQKMTPYSDDSDSKRDWALVFDDEFRNNNSLNDNWIIEEASPGHILSSRWKTNVKIKKGKLLLLNKKEYKGGKTWTSGSITCKRKFKYGYFECKLQISKANAINNAFWLYANNNQVNHRFELDIVEAHYPNKIQLNLHDLGSSEHTNIQYASWLYRDNLSSQYHIYAVDWEPDFIKFYFDGKLIRSERNVFCHDEANLALSTAVIDWDGKVTDKIDGTCMKVEYIRVFSKNN